MSVAGVRVVEFGTNETLEALRVRTQSVHVSVCYAFRAYNKHIHHLQILLF